MMFTNSMHTSACAISLSTALMASTLAASASGITTRIPDTGVTTYYDENSRISAPSQGRAFFGQDAHFRISEPSYANNGDGTITDRVTGLMWEQSMGAKMTMQEAVKKANRSRLGGHSDWRIPTVTELYSLIQFTGRNGRNAHTPFIDTGYFQQPFGNASRGERPIDAQTWSATEYGGRTMNNDHSYFGVNFIDGRIKAYPTIDPRSRGANRLYFRMVRGNPNYGDSDLVNAGNGTILDRATGLMWAKDDSHESLDWQAALEYCNDMQLSGHSDWRLPNAKELQSIVDYNRAPASTGSAAISRLFNISVIRDPSGRKNYPQTWTSTTHLDGRDPEASAVYICFGECQGRMRGRLMDAHGAGAQRSDPKSGNARDYPQYFGPQGDIRYVYNYARCVRGASR